MGKTMVHQNSHKERSFQVSRNHVDTFTLEDK